MRTLLRALLWAATAAFALCVLGQPVGLDAQLALAGTVLAAMALVWRFGRGRLARWMFLALGSLVVLRYMAWRLAFTLPTADQPTSLAFGILLLAAEVYCVLILVVSLIVNADPLERPRLEAVRDADLPNVDIFIPTYNEDVDILGVTVAAARSMDYPNDKLTVWLLDDGGTDQKLADADPRKAAAAAQRRTTLQALCAGLGARYLTRARNEHAKAGNLNNGLQASQGEIVVVFDADHAPFRSFLRETIGLFSHDPKLFLVQTPHVFLNPDPIERNLQTFATMPSENEMFYFVTQRGLDKWNASFFCGSAALLRRAALDMTGGFSGITITEDCETAFELHAKGWHSAYVDKPLIAGLQPETFESFIGQRSRWCQGMFQILLLKNPIFKKGLRPIQKLAYLSSMTFWFFPLPRMIFTFAPLLHVFFDVKIFVSSMDEALAYTATYMAANLMLQNYLYGRFRWPFVSELYEYVQGVYLAKAIAAVLVRPRTPTFNVTAKGILLDEDRLSGLARPFFAIFLLLFVGAGMAFYRYLTEPGAELMLIVGLWTSFNLLIAAAALGAVAERRQLARFPSLATRRPARLRLGDRAVPVTVEAVSAGGCVVHPASPDATLANLAKGTVAELIVEPLHGAARLPPLPLKLTMPETEHGLTFEFGAMRPQTYMSLADLMYGDPEAIARFIAGRRRHMSIPAAAAVLLRWATLEPVRALTYLGRAIVARSASKADPSPVATAAEAPNLLDELLAATQRHAHEPGLAPNASVVRTRRAETGSTRNADEIDATSDWIAAVLALAARDRQDSTQHMEPADVIAAAA